MTQPPLDHGGPRPTRTRTWFPVARPSGAGGAGPVHAIDGDGTAFCGGAPAAALHPVADIGWYDVAPSRRCPDCRIALFGAGADEE